MEIQMGNWEEIPERSQTGIPGGYGGMEGIPRGFMEIWVGSWEEIPKRPQMGILSAIPRFFPLVLSFQKGLVFFCRV